MGNHNTTQQTLKQQESHIGQMTIKNKIIELLKQLNHGVIEKEEVIALSLLSSVAGESIFLLGPPGVAKSLVARRLKYAYKNGSSFEYLMNRFSTPDEIFGPVSISQLKNHDKYERVVKNYLPTATVVFLDEIWKAGPSIQNALLTVLNEKIYRNGEQEIKLPMKVLISASNELPSKGEGLEALWDRFLVRLIVDGVKDKQNFNDMISKSLNSYSDTVDEALKITDDEYNKWNKQIDEIEIPDYVFDVIHVIRSFIDQYNQREENKKNPIYISDRRWRKIVRLLRTSAFLNDRKSVDLMDCFLIKHCLWNETEQIQAVSQFVRDAIQKHGYKLSIDLSDIVKELKDIENDVKTETSFLKEVKAEIPEVFEDRYYKPDGFRNPEFKISKEDYDSLTYDKSKRIYLDHYDYYGSRRTETFLVRKGKENHIIIDGEEYKLKTTTKTDKKKFTRKPHPSVKKEWDRRVEMVLTTLNNLKSQIDNYKQNDLKHIKVNLFVNPIYAEVVESNLHDLEKEIEKLEIEANRIKHYYENVEAQTEDKEVKALKNE